MNISSGDTRQGILDRLGGQKFIRPVRIFIGQDCINIGNVQFIGVFRAIRITFIGDLSPIRFNDFN